LSLQDYADIAQVVSSLAVIVSLIVVAIELRQTWREMFSSTQQAQSDAHSGYLVALATSPELVPVVAKSTRGDPLSELEQIQASLFLNAVFTQFQAGFHSAQLLGRRSLRGWEHQERALGRWLMTPMVRDWWRRDRALFADDFQGLVDAKIAQAAQGPNEPSPPG